ncbi:MAG: DNA topoisomerase (ATP-hydrolyzing) subunit A [Clostridia bacterium]|nr:DNA topoisomerase (ATP-hydrolyzing) subunit A [Clostridia bacterium]
MARKKKQEEEQIIEYAPVIEQPITETLVSNYMPHAMSVIISRAIPEIDGLKPAHRKLLYTMYKMGLLGGKMTKSANVVGQTMKLNPHGDAAIYETMVRLTRGNESLLHPLVESQGNFGKQYSRDMAYAASRYTEVRLEPICQELFGDINKNTVEFVDNYDGEMKEPTLLPVAFPNIIVNPNQGIAVGMASNICSFNLREVCEATIAYMKDENADIIEIMPAPDFPLGAELIYNKEEMQRIYDTGRGSFRLRAKYIYDKSNNCIEILEIPYTTTCEAIIGKIMELIKANKLKEISDARDETGLDGFKITLDLKRGTDPDTLMTKLYKLTPLEDSFSCNFNILINAHPMVLGIKEILKHWIDFRMGCIKNSIKYDIEKKSEKLHLLTGLKKILLDIDKAISIIRHTELEQDVVPNLMDGFDIDKIQAEYIAEIKLRNLNKEYILNRTSEIEKLMEELEELNRILGSDKEIKKLISKQLTQIAKKYGKERRTQLISGEDLQVYNENDVIEDYPVTVFFTKENYLKKISAVSLRSSSAEHKLKEDDIILQTIETTNKSELLFFTNKSTVYKIKTYDISDGKVSTIGEYLPGILGLEEDEKILYTVVTVDYGGMMLFTFENGKIAKVELNNYATKTNRKKLVGAYSDKAPICDIRLINEDIDIVLMSDNNRILCLNTDKIPLKATKSTQGVQALTLRKKGAKLIKVLAVSECDIDNPEKYKTKNIPAAGSILKSEDTQISLID